MKPHSIIAVVALTLSASAFASGDHAHGQSHTPRHGGVVAETRQLDHELVVRPDVIRLYLSDHGEPVDIAKASAKLTLLSGGEKQEVELRPAGDRLEAAGSFKVGAGTKVVAVVSGAGKSTSTARFTLPR